MRHVHCTLPLHASRPFVACVFCLRQTEIRAVGYVSASCQGPMEPLHNARAMGSLFIVFSRIEM